MACIEKSEIERAMIPAAAFPSGVPVIMAFLKLR